MKKISIELINLYDKYDSVIRILKHPEKLNKQELSNKVKLKSELLKRIKTTIERERNKVALNSHNYFEWRLQVLNRTRANIFTNELLKSQLKNLEILHQKPSFTVVKEMMLKLGLSEYEIKEHFISTGMHDKVYAFLSGHEVNN